MVAGEGAVDDPCATESHGDATAAEVRQVVADRAVFHIETGAEEPDTAARAAMVAVDRHPAQDEILSGWEGERAATVDGTTATTDKSVDQREVGDLDGDRGVAGEPEDAARARIGHGRAVDHRVARAGAGQDEVLVDRDVVQA